jgi:signal transduction histidine kinase
MPDSYQIPTLILTTLLIPAFAHLYLRSRDTRTLLWFLAFCLTVVRMFLLYPLHYRDFADGVHPWLAAAGQSCALLASGLFLASLSPLRFRIGKFEVLYVIPYILPMVVYAVLAYGVFGAVAPHGPLFAIFPTLGGISLLVGLRWGQTKGSMPVWVGTTACLLFGGFAMWFCFRQGLHLPLVVAESGNHLIAALLVLFVFRRLSPGVVLSVLGFVAWSLPGLLVFQTVSGDPTANLYLTRCIVMAKLVTAMGLILVALENELVMNQAAGERERRARCEMEAYTSLELSRRRVEDFDRQGPEICRTVVTNSRFAQAALILLQPAGMYRVVGSAGIDPAVARALDLWAARVPVAGFLAAGSVPSAVGNSQTLQLDLTPWLTPGDDLVRLRFTSTLAVPLMGRSGAEGALLLAGLRERQPTEPLRSEDLLPIEMLASRIQAVRSQTTMLDKLIDSEKFAGIGQLAGSVTQQLNNPLTVILGYASLLEDAGQLEAHERKAISAILIEARHMRTTLESLSRIALSHGQRAAISLPELLADLEHLHRSEFLQRSIEFRLNVAPSLPRVLCHAQQLRQAILHCLQFAMDSVENVSSSGDRTVRLEATSEGNRVQILVAHTGPGFHHPERAFDPYLPTQAGRTETAGLGLSLCATILRDNNGNVSAVNLEPQGAAILLELQAA